MKRELESMKVAIMTRSMESLSARTICPNPHGGWYISGTVE